MPPQTVKRKKKRRPASSDVPPPIILSDDYHMTPYDLQDDQELISPTPTTTTSNELEVLRQLEEDPGQSYQDIVRQIEAESAVREAQRPVEGEMKTDPVTGRRYRVKNVQRRIDPEGDFETQTDDPHDDIVRQKLLTGGERQAPAFGPLIVGSTETGEFDKEYLPDEPAPIETPRTPYQMGPLQPIPELEPLQPISELREEMTDRQQPPSPSPVLDSLSQETMPGIQQDPLNQIASTPVQYEGIDSTAQYAPVPERYTAIDQIGDPYDPDYVALYGEAAGRPIQDFSESQKMARETYELGRQAIDGAGERKELSPFHKKALGIIEKAIDSFDPVTQLSSSYPGMGKPPTSLDMLNKMAEGSVGGSLEMQARYGITPQQIAKEELARFNAMKDANVFKQNFAPLVQLVKAYNDILKTTDPDDASKILAQMNSSIDKMTKAQAAGEIAQQKAFQSKANVLKDAKNHARTVLKNNADIINQENKTILKQQEIGDKRVEGDRDYDLEVLKHERPSRAKLLDLQQKRDAQTAQDRRQQAQIAAQNRRTEYSQGQANKRMRKNLETQVWRAKEGFDLSRQRLEDANKRHLNNLEEKRLAREQKRPIDENKLAISRQNLEIAKKRLEMAQKRLDYLNKKLGQEAPVTEQDIDKLEAEHAATLGEEDRRRWGNLDPERRREVIRQIAAQKRLSRDQLTKLMQSENRLYGRAKQIYDPEKDIEVANSFNAVMEQLERGSPTDVETAMVNFRTILGDPGNKGQKEVERMINSTIYDSLIKLIGRLKISGAARLPRERVREYQGMVETAYQGYQYNLARIIDKWMREDPSTEEWKLKRYGLDPKKETIQSFTSVNRNFRVHNGELQSWDGPGPPPIE